MIVAIWEQHTSPAASGKSQLMVAPGVGNTLQMV